MSNTRSRRCSGYSLRPLRRSCPLNIRSSPLSWVLSQHNRPAGTPLSGLACQDSLLSRTFGAQFRRGTLAIESFLCLFSVHLSLSPFSHFSLSAVSFSTKSYNEINVNAHIPAISHHQHAFHIHSSSSLFQHQVSGLSHALDEDEVNPLTFHSTRAQLIPGYMTSSICTHKPSATHTSRNPTECAPNACYTHTVTVPESGTVCAQTIGPICRPLQCFRAETKTIPCASTCCQTTPTVTSYKPCQTTCELSCPTVTVSCSSMLA